MAADRARILLFIADIAATLVTDALDLAAINDRIDAAAALDATAFSVEVLEIVRIVAENAATPADVSLFTAPADVGAATGDAFAVLIAVALAIAVPRIDWPSRPAARTARAQLATAADAALSVASGLGADGVDLYVWLDGLTSVAIRIVSDIAANAVPVVRIETGMSLPSTVLAYQLYGDAARSEGLVDVARSMTPMLMPSAFEALES